jgi:hypothetical protein
VDPANRTGRAGATLAEASNDLLDGGGKHVSASAAVPAMAGTSHLAAWIVADQPGQGWSLLCNGVILFDDGGELLPDGDAVTPDRHGLAYLVAMAA